MERAEVVGLLLPHAGRYVELVMLAVSLLACVVMWVLARRIRGAELSTRHFSSNAVHEAAYQRLRNTYLSVYTLATCAAHVLRMCRACAAYVPCICVPSTTATRAAGYRHTCRW